MLNRYKCFEVTLTLSLWGDVVRPEPTIESQPPFFSTSVKPWIIDFEKAAKKIYYSLLQHPFLLPIT
jgi:hypothetical protein